MPNNLYNRPNFLMAIPSGELKERLYPKFSMVTPESMELTINASEHYYLNKKSNSQNNIKEGVVVECGIWKGGMGILLAKYLPDKKIYLCDSFKGFEAIKLSPYSLEKAIDLTQPANGKERHHPGNPSVIIKGEHYSWEVSESEVINNLNSFGLEISKHGIELISGYIRDSLPPKLDKELSKISILRIDLDAFAATYECLKLLYDKVETGGIIIFDDAFDVEEADSAIELFFSEREIDPKFIPDKRLGCYMEKI